MAQEESAFAKGGSRLEELQGVIEGFRKLVGEFSQSIEDQLGLDRHEEQRQVARVLTTALNNQCEALGRIMLDHQEGRVDEEQLAQARIYLAATGVTGILDQTRALMADGKLQKKSLLSWVIFILEVIKNILPILAGLLNFGKKLISLIMAILEIIEKILRMLTAFLGPEAAFNADQSQLIMWSSLERYWRTKAAFDSNPD